VELNQQQANPFCQIAKKIIFWYSLNNFNMPENLAFNLVASRSEEIGKTFISYGEYQTSK